jgi:hypothetical protein
MLLTYFLNDFEMVPVAPIITGISSVFTFHMRCISIVRSLYFRIFSAYCYYYYYYYYSREARLLLEKVRISETVQNFSAIYGTPCSHPLHKPWHLTSSWAIWNQNIPTIAPCSSQLPTNGLLLLFFSCPTKTDHKLKWSVIQKHNAVYQQTSTKGARYL